MSLHAFISLTLFHTIAGYVGLWLSGALDTLSYLFRSLSTLNILRHLPVLWDLMRWILQNFAFCLLGRRSAFLLPFEDAVEMHTFCSWAYLSIDIVIYVIQMQTSNVLNFSIWFNLLVLPLTLENILPGSHHILDLLIARSMDTFCCSLTRRKFFFFFSTSHSSSRMA